MTPTADEKPARISLAQWDSLYERLRRGGNIEAGYGGPLRRLVAAGDTRLECLSFDNSAAALRLWNFVLTETRRLYAAKEAGQVIVGAMKDLGTVPVIAYARPNVTAFYPDGTWWAPCIMENSTHDLAAADARGIDESFCPVRAMLGAFASLQHFPKPDVLTCSVGATCDDFSAIAQRLASLGWPITWWDVPRRRNAEGDEISVSLPGGVAAPESQVRFVAGQLGRVREAIEKAAGPISDEMLRESIREANRVRRILAELRGAVFEAKVCPLPALEVLLAEMLALHYCSDRDETVKVLTGLVALVRGRVGRGEGVLAADAVRIYWVNPVADLRAMNLLEDCGGRLAGTDFMFCHALDLIPEDVAPMEALARAALADPMVGTARQRAERICREARAWNAEAVVVSRIPGASHCGWEGAAIAEVVREQLDLPVVELEVPPMSDGVAMALRTRLEAVVEIVRERRR